jgi:hypothetical protein
VVIDDAGHNTLDASPEYGRVLRAFLTQSAREAAQQ